jgi:protein MpaA
VTASIGELWDIFPWVRSLVLPLIAVLLLASCSGSDTESVEGQSPTAVSEAEPALVESAPTPVPTTTSIETPSTTVAASTTTPTSTSTTIIPSTTTSTSIPPIPDVPGPLDLQSDFVGLGFSVEGRPIFAERFGTPGGRRALVIGAIHGDEDDGVEIIDELRSKPVPDGVELWLVESMNPDGQANRVRHNGNAVDLNRNFPYKWGPIGEPGNSQYAGVGPASEPETQALVNFISQLQPDIAIWYHQDLFVVNPASGREGRVRARYAELSGLPMGQITGGTYTGIAATWARTELSAHDGVAFIVELGVSLTPAETTTHADAVLTVASEG